ncbi:MAG TPA: hypothetical protein VHL57_09860 [Flavobacteriales bacterium]|jgi:hypothetical protein|nr:hypothetical protein [Flavobacteriales bacterium]
MEIASDDPGLPAVVKWLHKHLVVAHFDLAEYKRIYSADQEDLDVLNSTGQLFFTRLHRLYWSSFIQTAGRLMDPDHTKVGGSIRENASIARLVRKGEGLPFHAKLVALVEEARSEWEPLKNIRNRVVSHNDLEVITAPTEKLNARTASIERIYALAGDVVKLYYSHYENMGISYDAWHSAGATTMLSFLKRGMKAWEVEREELMRG